MTKVFILSLGGGSDNDQETVVNDNMVRFWCPEMTQEGQWHNLTLVLHRAGIMKNSNISVFLDGELVNSQKVFFKLKPKVKELKHNYQKFIKITQRSFEMLKSIILVLVLCVLFYNPRCLQQCTYNFWLYFALKTWLKIY